MNQPLAGDFVTAAEEYVSDEIPGAELDSVIWTPDAAKSTPRTIGWAAAEDWSQIGRAHV